MVVAAPVGLAIMALAMNPQPAGVIQPINQPALAGKIRLVKATANGVNALVPDQQGQPAGLVKQITILGIIPQRSVIGRVDVQVLNPPVETVKHCLVVLV